MLDLTHLFVPVCIFSTSRLPKVGCCAEQTLLSWTETRPKCWAVSCVPYPFLILSDLTYRSHCRIHHRKKISPRSTADILANEAGSLCLAYCNLQTP